MTRNRRPLYDRRTDSLPRPAVNLAARLVQLSRQTEAVSVRVTIINHQWVLWNDGKVEVLGSNGED